MRNFDNESYSYSPEWKIDDSKFEKEIVKLRDGNTREIYFFDISKDKSSNLVTNHPEYGNNLFVHEHKVIKLKTATNFFCDIVLRVHYNSYVTKTVERKRCFDLIPFRYNSTFYTKSFQCDMHDSLFVENLTLKEFAQLYNTTPSIVRSVYSDSEMRSRQVKPVDIESISHLVIKEYRFNSEKKICTIVFEVESGLLLYAGQGQTGEQVKEFFSKYKKVFMDNVTEIYVSEDNQSYIDAIKEEYPNIKINNNFQEAYDIFVKHILSQIKCER